MGLWAAATQSLTRAFRAARVPLAMHFSELVSSQKPDEAAHAQLAGTCPLVAVWVSPGAV